MPCTLGMDPEFVFVKYNEIVAASRFLSGHRSFGTDGCSYLAELRPRPNTEPKEVIKSMLRSMRTTLTRKSELMNYEWRAGSYFGGYPLGGHIHIGYEHTDSNDKRDKKIKLTKAFDNLLAPIVLLMEDKKEAVRRRTSSYGHLNDSRETPWGLEYRVLPSFIASPLITEAVLCMSKMITETTLEDGLNFATPFAVDRMKFKKCEKSSFRAELNHRWEFFVNHSLWEQYKEPLKGFKRLLNDNIIFSNFADMKETWSVETERMRKFREQKDNIRPIEAEQLWGTL